MYQMMVENRYVMVVETGDATSIDNEFGMDVNDGDVDYLDQRVVQQPEHPAG